MQSYHMPGNQSWKDSLAPMTTTSEKIPIFLLLYFGHGYPSRGRKYKSEVWGIVRCGSRLIGTLSLNNFRGSFFKLKTLRLDIKLGPGSEKGLYK